MSGMAGERFGERFAIAFTVPRLDLRQRHGRLHHQQIDLPSEQIRHGGTGAAVGHELNLGARRLLAAGYRSPAPRRSD